MRRKICVVTGTRAEYGLLYGLMQKIRVHPSLQLQVVASGMHLSPEFGLTYREIGRALGISLGSVANSLVRAFARLSSAGME